MGIDGLRSETGTKPFRGKNDSALLNRVTVPYRPYLLSSHLYRNIVPIVPYSVVRRPSFACLPADIHMYVSAHTQARFHVGVNALFFSYPFVPFLLSDLQDAQCKGCGASGLPSQRKPLNFCDVIYQQHGYPTLNMESCYQHYYCCYARLLLLCRRDGLAMLISKDGG